MTAPARVADYVVTLHHANGGTSVRGDLTLNEARDYATRQVTVLARAAAATITDADGRAVGSVEAGQ
jgi:hypothetical protein